MSRKKIYIAVTNDLVTDQRVHKVATSLHREKGDVVLVGRHLPGSISVDRQYKTLRMHLLFKRSALFYFEYNLRLFFLLLFKHVDIVVANDLDTLLAGYWVAKIKKAGFVYDSHEYFTEVPELINRVRVRRVWLFIEKCILPKVQHCYTVCSSIAKIYNEKYGIDMKVVRNVPLRRPNKPSVVKSVPPVIIYQGALNIGRGIEESIRSMKYVNNAVLWIYGSGDIVNEIAELIKREKLQDKVELKGRVSLDVLAKETEKASLGLSLEKGREMGESYYYSLPNKIFDYIQAGVPVLVSDLPEKKDIVNKFKIGFLMKGYEPEVLGKQINDILSNKLDKFEGDLTRAAQELCWENEEKELLSVYYSL